MDLRSMPSCTISQRGDMSLSFCTCWLTLFTTKSTSASVVNRPIPNRMELCAISSSAPSARKTYEGSRDADVHAEPEERAISFNAMSKDSPSTYANERLTHPKFEKCQNSVFVQSKKRSRTWIRLDGVTISCNMIDVGSNAIDETPGKHRDTLVIILQIHHQRSVFPVT